MGDHRPDEPGGRGKGRSRGNVFNFRRLKWGDPQQRLQMLFPFARAPMSPSQEPLPLPRGLRIINTVLLGVIFASALVIMVYVIDRFVS